jgi:peptide/nickel transport system permease protein
VSNLPKKILYAFFTVFLAITTIFFVIRLSPGDPLETVLGPKASLEDIQKLKTQLGMDKNIWIQYYSYLKGIVVGDLGKSLIGSKDVKKLIIDRMSSSMTLAFLSVSIASIVGMFLGILAGNNKSRALDNYARVVTLLALSFPIFSLGPILVLIFSIKLKLFPVSEWGELKHVFLPVLTLVIPLSAVITRVSRNKFLEEINAQWVVVLKAKGLSELQILLRVIKICLPTILTVVSIQLSVVIAGTMITETIYDIPGIGSLLFDGIAARDYPVVQGVIVYSTIMYMIIYFLLDFTNEKIDPRLSSGSSDD